MPIPSTRTRYVTRLEFVDVLRQACRRAGGQSALARLAGCSQAYVNDVLRGRRDPGRKILHPLGYDSPPLRYVKTNREPVV